MYCMYECMYVRMYAVHNSNIKNVLCTNIDTTSTYVCMNTNSTIVRMLLSRSRSRSGSSMIVSKPVQVQRFVVIFEGS